MASAELRIFCEEKLGQGTVCRQISFMADEPPKIFDLMDIETEPTDEQLAELMRLVGEDIQAESARIRQREGQAALKVAENKTDYGRKPGD